MQRVLKVTSPPMKGEDVTKLQKKLLEIGQMRDEESCTGEYDDETEGAVKNFQSENSLAETGQVDAKTWKAIMAAQP